MAESPQIDKENLTKECRDKKIALSCAKLGYYFQKINEPYLSFEFYQKGCSLGDEASCFNAKNSNPKEKYSRQVDAMMKFHTQNITNCYQKNKDLKHLYSNTQLKEKQHNVAILIHINRKGEADRINISSSLPDRFQKCAKEVVAAIGFPKPEKTNITYKYNLTILGQEL